MALIIRWLPMIFFLFIGAQKFSSREGVPLRTISLIMRRQWKKAKSRPTVANAKERNISYFILRCVCPPQPSMRRKTSYYWGLCVFVAWGLWARRPCVMPYIWAGALGMAIVLGVF